MPFLHFDEAKPAAEAALRTWLATTPAVEKRALLVVDLFGTLRLALWSCDEAESEALSPRLEEAAGAWWSCEILRLESADDITRSLYEGSWKEAHRDPEEPRLAVLDRHRSRTGWFVDLEHPIWEIDDEAPPVVVFYSFKGGLGRSTILASFAIQRAREGERVCVLDLDLDSPGVGGLLAADAAGLTAQWGVVDFLIEQHAGETPLGDYYHRCDRVAGPGEITVFPAGQVNDVYPDKLARVDLEDVTPVHEGGLTTLLRRVREELKPQWILLDARTGISEPAGQLLSGLAHLHVLLGTTQDQSWQGINRVLDRLGAARVADGRAQAEVVLVQSLVPAGEAGQAARNAFLARAEQELTDRYYAEAPGDESEADSTWSIGDMDSLDAPHVAIPVEYDSQLASFGDIDDVADLLCRGAYSAVAERIQGRFARDGDT